jgi:hypothetical protein
MRNETWFERKERGRETCLEKQEKLNKESGEDEMTKV